ncbi:uncharacterized protein BT62DRAFT_924947 [Guyanagaster necrorhizus]|uniref:Uncharacterized protein n=1 Tax=Guyanagaster necrorhizus TaxID=856835 RepID=A0A9P7VEG1_9AGAR|nr:uncharacterized protein BT62DRAFT_924947 [Guyanagaster necrorhizus MCA 3950]KAG7439062.1 hypothetical protein BT62DRAFT_924947 [Guyanagaster necrorhizus MCA 3950]
MDTSGVDQQGTGQRLSEVLCGLRIEHLKGLLSDIITNVQSPTATVQEHFMSLLAMRAERMIIINYLNRCIQQSSITLVGELIFKVSGISEKTCDLDKENVIDASTAESSCYALFCLSIIDTNLESIGDQYFLNRVQEILSKLIKSNNCSFEQQEVWKIPPMLNEKIMKMMSYLLFNIWDSRPLMKLSLCFWKPSGSLESPGMSLQALKEVMDVSSLYFSLYINLTFDYRLVNDIEELNTLMMVLLGWSVYYRQLISAVEDDYKDVYASAIQTIDIFLRSIPKDKLESFVVPLWWSVKSTGALGHFVPGFSVPKAVGPLIPAIIAGLTTSSNEQWEQAAYAIGHLMDYMQDTVIKPFVVSFTGLLI